MTKTPEIIERLDRYMRLVRYQYTELERLSRLKMVDDFYAMLDTKPTNEILSSKLLCAESLQNTAFQVPLKVKGVFLSVGRPKRKYYTENELIKAVNNPINQKFPLMVDHKDTEVGSVIGVVTKIEYDPTIKGIRWWGHVNNETQALNVYDGVVKEVSATIYSESEYDSELGLIGTNLVFKELSFVFDGADPLNSVEVDN